MGQKTRVLVDTNVLIRQFRGDVDTHRLIKQIGWRSIDFSVISEAELLFGARKKELPATHQLLARYRPIQIDERISMQFLDLMRTQGYAHGMTIPDALIAATALSRGIPLCTYNQRDFESIDGIKLYPI